MIIFDGATKSYSTPSRSALDGVSAHIDKGEFVFLIGPPGSGKSTSPRLMVREEKMDSGKLTVANQDLTKTSRRNIPKLCQKAGYVLQNFRLLLKKTVHENVASVLQVTGKSKAKIDKAVLETLEMVGLPGKENHYPHELSGGEQQWVTIAHAFVNRSLILFADESTGNFDPSTSGDIMLLLNRINRMGTTAIASTHDNDVVDSMRRRVLELELGRLVRDDATDAYGLNNQQAVHRQKDSFERYY